MVYLGTRLIHLFYDFFCSCLFYELFVIDNINNTYENSSMFQRSGEATRDI